MKIWITILLCFFATNFLQAKEMSEVAETKELAEKIIRLFEQEKFTNAIEMAKAYWPIPESEIDGLGVQIVKQWPYLKKRFGAGQGMEYIGSETIGSSFIRYFYLHKFQNHAIFWQLTFYKAKSTWQINGISFKDKLDYLYQVKR